MGATGGVAVVADLLEPIAVANNLALAEMLSNRARLAISWIVYSGVWSDGEAAERGAQRSDLAVYCGFGDLHRTGGL